jgi:hypothetical protein
LTDTYFPRSFRVIGGFRGRILGRRIGGGVSCQAAYWSIDIIGTEVGRCMLACGRVGLFWVAGSGVGVVPDRLVVDLGGDGQAAVMSWPDGGMPEEVSRAPLAWPLDEDALEYLRW